MFNQSLIQYILQKLKTGDSRSININAIPGKLATRFDISDFSDIDPNLLQDFFNKLFNNSSFKFKLDLGSIEVEDENKEKDDNNLFEKLTSDKISKKKWGILLKRLNTIIASEEDEFQEHGVKSFGFGYPLLIKKTPRDFGEDKVIIAPVFIWKLTIERLKSSKYTYQISRDEEMGLGLNEVLLGNLETNDKIIIKQLGEDIIDDGILKPQELLKNLNSLLSKCGSSQVYSELQKTQKIPSSKKELEEFYGSQGLEKPAIFWGGVFGLYRTLKEKIIEDTKKLPIEDNLIDNEDIDQFFDFEHPYGSVNTDPSQQTILDNLKEKEGMVIQGPPGTGKSQTITAIITNALDNNKKCLVVCEKKTALEVIKNNLSKIGLGDMCALIEDVNTARKDIVELVRNKQEHGFGYSGFKGNEYRSILKEVDSLIEKNTYQKELLRKDYFNNIDRKSLVGNYLKKSREADNEIIDEIHEEIAEHIKDHSYENYNILFKIIKEAEELNFPGVNTIFLNKLKTSIFIENGSYITCKNQFEKFIKQLSENRENLETKIKKFESIIENNKKDYDIIFNNNYNVKNKFIKNGEKGEYINIIINNYQILGDDISSDRLNKIINNKKQKDIKKGEEVYNSNLNPKIIKDYIDSFEEDVVNQQSFHDIVISENSLLIEKVKDIIFRIDALQTLSNTLLSKYENSGNLSSLNSLKHNVFGLFSQKHKEIRKLQKTIYYQYDELKKNIYNEGLKNIIENLKEYKKYDNITSLYSQLDIIKDICTKCSLNKISEKGLEVIIYEKEIDRNWNLINQIIEENNILVSQYLKSKKSYPINSLSNIYNQLELYKNIENNLKEDKNNLEKFYDRVCFYHKISQEQKEIINKFLNIGIVNRSSLFEIIWLKDILLSNDVNGLPKNDHDILKLHGLVNDLKDHQIKGIKSKRKEMAENGMTKLKSKGITIQSLYNKRGAPGERRNSLRRIIATDFDLFTNIFPVLLVSPQVCSSILPLKKNLFDIVLFDEASQIRLEDVMSAMYRGKQKIICGDQHQMPPSNFFAGSNILLEANDDDPEENNDDIEFTGSDLNTQLANSESLLDYAEKKGYLQYMLKIHYRSEHPKLIDFSNFAFYGGRLQALPNKKEYTPISFYEVEGELHKGVNEKEAIKVIEILQSILSEENINKKYNGVIPSIGIATFNLYQRNYIWDIVQKIKYENTVPELANKLDHVNLFVKNLDTIQGDERDIIIISTTFAKKTDGKYAQNYGPINQSKGYRLLNVMITRAKKEVHLITSIPSEIYTQFEEKLRNSKSETKHGGSLLHAYINYCKSVHENNEPLRLSILEKIRGGENHKEQEEGMTESPFEEEVLNSLCEIIDPNRIKLQHKVGGFRIDMIILSKKNNKPLIAIECDGATYHSGDIAYCNDIFRQDILEGLGFVFHRIRSSNRWRDKQNEEKKLMMFLKEIEEL